MVINLFMIVEDVSLMVRVEIVVAFFRIVRAYKVFMREAVIVWKCDYDIVMVRCVVEFKCSENISSCCCFLSSGFFGGFDYLIGSTKGMFIVDEDGD